MRTVKLPDLAAVEAMDARDPLRSFRGRFTLPEGVVYLDGNSLGAASPAVLSELQTAATREWGEGLIRSWNGAGWWQLPTVLGDKIGRLIGAAPGQTVVCDTVSANIYKLLHAAMALKPERSVIVAEQSSFPTDLYMAESVAASRPGACLRLEGTDAAIIDDLLDARTAVVLVNHVNYRSGALRDMAALTRKVHAAGAIVIWDLSHSAGALPVDLDAAGVDFAVGCTYKYLNGGPGAPAYIYAAARHQAHIQQPLSGWWGHARPFAFESGYVAAAGIRRFLCGTQPVLSLAALKGALGLWDDVDMAAIRAKSIALTELFIQLVEARCGPYGLMLESPRAAAERGSHVSLLHPHGYAIMRALAERGVIGDFRAPASIRFGFTPLYTSYRDVWQAVVILEDILRTKSWQDARFSIRGAVT